METNNIEMTPEVTEVNGTGTNALGMYLVAGATMAWMGFVVIPVYRIIKTKVLNRKAKLRVVEDEDNI